MNIIDVNDVCLTLSKTEILKHINVSFEEGKIHGLIGRNGSGKTMLMKCICGFVKPTSGEIAVDGKKVGKLMNFLIIIQLAAVLGIVFVLVSIVLLVVIP